jgi:addiction module RelE/StbE family toxin
MPETFSVLTTPAFERDFRKVSKGNPILINALEELIATLREDPCNYSGQHKIKKLVGVSSGEGQWLIRWRDYRLRYDIMDKDVILHAFRHRKDAY